MIEKIQELESEINEKLKSNNVVVRILGNEDKNKGSIIILKDKKINRCFEIEIISCCQINIIENSKKIETGLFIEDLENWIYNLYNPIEYLYEFVGGKLNNRILTREEINEISNELTKDYSEERKKGIAVHRKELDNQPTVEGYLGPMYNGIDYGKIILRYETIVKRAYRKAELDENVYTVHTLRHTCATLLYRSGVNIKTIQELLGHVHIDTTEIYTHLDNQEVKDVMFEHPLAQFKMEDALAYCA